MALANPPSTGRRRSCLSVPASSDRMLAKAATLGADEVVVDLEDGVAAGAKEAARLACAAFLDTPDLPSVAVRVNAPGTPWCHADIVAMTQTADRPLSIVVPKVESPGDLEFVERLLAGAETAARRRHPVRVQALIETAGGLARVYDIAAASERLDALIVGYADLAASLGRTYPSALGLDTWLPAQERVLTAARARGLQAIDGPYLGTDAGDGFRAAATRARSLGFDGKWAVHPSQLGALNELFQPSEDEVTHACAVIDTLRRAESADGRGAVAMDGEMLDEALRASALRVLARAGIPSTGSERE
jgi:citrate lyase subunit beta/citryl-CoA lyase